MAMLNPMDGPIELQQFGICLIKAILENSIILHHKTATTPKFIKTPISQRMAWSGRKSDDRHNSEKVFKILNT